MKKNKDTAIKIEEKEKVIIISYYDEDNLDISVKKEENLKKYCERKNYEVVEIVREMSNLDLSNMFYNYYRVLRNNYGKCIRTIVMYSTEEFFKCDEAIAVLGDVADLNGFCLETIKQGIFDEDIKYRCIVDDNPNILENNKEFIVNEDDLPF